MARCSNLSFSLGLNVYQTYAKKIHELRLQQLFGLFLVKAFLTFIYKLKSANENIFRVDTAYLRESPQISEPTSLDREHYDVTTASS